MSIGAIHFDFGDPQLASLYDEVSLWSMHFGELMLRQLQPAHGQMILDVGCGTGYPTFALAYFYGPSSQIIGLDVWEAAIQRAEQRRDYFRLEHVSFVKPDGDTYPFPDDHFDLITSNLGINNFENPPRVLKECAHVLKPGGHLAITTNFKGHMAEFYAVYRQVLLDYGNSEYLERFNHHEDHRGTVESHRALLEDAGFIIEKIVTDQFTWRFLDGTALFQHPVIRFGFLPAWLEIVDEPDRELVFTELEYRLNAYADNHEELSLTIPMLYLGATL